jgi:hypothetical protein
MWLAPCQPPGLLPVDQEPGGVSFVDESGYDFDAHGA